MPAINSTLSPSLLSTTLAPTFTSTDGFSDSTGLQIIFAPLFIALSFFSIAVSFLLLYAKIYAYYFGNLRAPVNTDADRERDSSMTDPRFKLGLMRNPYYQSLIPECPYSSAENSSLQCSVCLSPITSGELCRKLPDPCTHTFHSQCIIEWFSYSDLCPLCKRSVVTMLKSLHQIRCTPTESSGDIALLSVQSDVSEV